MSTICGHEREVLEWALDLWEEPDVAHAMAFAVKREDWGPSFTEADQKALADLHDTTKLAEIMADRLRFWGIYAYCYGKEGAVVIVDPRDVHNRSLSATLQLTMSQARAALLRILTMPEGTPTNEALNALEVGS